MEENNQLEEELTDRLRASLDVSTSKEKGLASILHSSLDDKRTALGKIDLNSPKGQPLEKNDRQLYKSTDKLNEILQYLEEADNAVHIQSSSSLSIKTETPSEIPRKDSVRGKCDNSPQQHTDLLKHVDLKQSVEVNRSTSFAEVCSGVHNRIKALQERLQSKSEALSASEAKLEESLKREVELEASFKESLSDALKKQSKEHEASLARHISFIDRLLKDKEALSQNCKALATEIKSLEDTYKEQTEHLQHKWTLEIRKQKEVWSSAEKARREVWLSEKTKEIRELTIKGLEPEIQRLVQKNKSDIESLEARHILEVKQKIEESKSYHDSYLSSMREQWRREKDDVIETERNSASQRLREQAERYEAQIESMRMRLITDNESKISNFESKRREEHERNQNAIMWLKKEHSNAISKIREENESKMENLISKHESQMKILKEKFETEQEGWRAMVINRIKEDYQSKEDSIREELKAEKNSELEMIVSKLEEENQLTKETIEDEFLKQDIKQKEAHNEEVARLQKRIVEYSDKYRESMQTLQHNEKELQSMESLQNTLHTELSAKNDAISFMEKQLISVKTELEGRQQNLKDSYEKKMQDLECRLENAMKDIKLANIANNQLNQKNEELRVTHEKDMLKVETRVKDALIKREVIISQLQEEMLSMKQNLDEVESL